VLTTPTPAALAITFAAATWSDHITLGNILQGIVAIAAAFVAVRISTGKIWREVADGRAERITELERSAALQAAEVAQLRVMKDLTPVIRVTEQIVAAISAHESRASERAERLISAIERLGPHRPSDRTRITDDA